VDRDHLQEMMVAALKHDGGFTLLDILQPCPSFNKLNTAEWYRDRVKPIGDDHDPTDMHAALDLAMKWGEEIPIGILYRNERQPMERQHPVLAEGPLVGRYAG
jgi:2-oxoglutarate ferredoxin oxidoreductase subunit beta